MKFKKKYDFIIILEYVLVLAVAGFMIIYPLATIKKFKISIFDGIFIALSILVIIFFLYNFLQIKYVIDDKNLYVRSGWNNQEFRLKDIVEINHKRKFFCSTITSIHTLEIVYSPYGTKADLYYAYVTVKNEEKFIELIKEKAKKIKIN